MHRTGVRAGLDILAPTVTLDGDTIDGPVVDTELDDPSRTLVKVEGDDRWHALPDSVRTRLVFAGDGI
jgi:hypothetical protein